MFYSNWQNKYVRNMTLPASVNPDLELTNVRHTLFLMYRLLFIPPDAPDPFNPDWLKPGIKPQDANVTAMIYSDESPETTLKQLCDYRGDTYNDELISKIRTFASYVLGCIGQDLWPHLIKLMDSYINDVRLSIDEREFYKCVRFLLNRFIQIANMR